MAPPTEKRAFGLIEVETLEGTAIHPIWSEDRQDWVPLGELQPGETLRSHVGLTFGPHSDETLFCSGGPAAVLSVSLHSAAQPVYNIEVHGHHVYQVGLLALLVQNTCEGHHTAFKYIPRGLNQYLNGTTSLKNLKQSLVKIPREVHRMLHATFNTTYKEFASYLGYKNIYRLLKNGQTTAAKLFDAMENITRQTPTGPELHKVLCKLSRLRQLF